MWIPHRSAPAEGERERERERSGPACVRPRRESTVTALTPPLCPAAGDHRPCVQGFLEVHVILEPFQVEQAPVEIQTKTPKSLKQRPWPRRLGCCCSRLHPLASQTPEPHQVQGLCLALHQTANQSPNALCTQERPSSLHGPVFCVLKPLKVTSHAIKGISCRG